MVHPAAFIASLLAAALPVVADECYTTTNPDTLTLTRGEGSFHGSIDIWGANCIGVEWQLQFNNNDQYNQQECTFDKNGATRLNLTVSDATYPFSCKAVDLATLDSGYFNLVYLGVNWEYNWGAATDRRDLSDQWLCRLLPSVGRRNLHNRL